MGGIKFGYTDYFIAPGVGALASGGNAPSTTVTVGGGGSFTPDAGYAVTWGGTNGSTITITKSGGGFGSKPNGVKPLYYIPLLTDLNMHSTLSRTTGNLSPDTTSVIQSSVAPPNMAAAGRVRACTSAKQTPPPILFQGAWVVPGVNTYVHAKRYYAHNSNYDSQGATNAATNKSLRIWPGPPTGGAVDIYYGDGTGGGGPASFIENISLPITSGGSGSYYNGMPWIQGAWFTDEVIYTYSTSGNFDGDWNIYRNARLTYAPSQKWKMQEPGATGPQTNGYFAEYSAGQSTSDFDSFDYYSKIYIDDSFCRVFVSTESSFNTAVNTGPSYTRELFIPTAWSNTSITAQVDFGQYASLSGLYLYWSNSAYSATRIGQFP